MHTAGRRRTQPFQSTAWVISSRRTTTDCWICSRARSISARTSAGVLAFISPAAMGDLRGVDPGRGLGGNLVVVGERLGAATELVERGAQVVLPGAQPRQGPG